MRTYKKTTIVLSIIFILFLIPFSNFGKGSSDIAYTFDDNILIDSSITEFDSTFNLKESSYYTEHYNATYSFENETDGTLNINIGFVDVMSNGISEIVANIDGHNKVIKVNNSAGSWGYIRNDFNVSVSGISNIEFWWYIIDSTNGRHGINIFDDIDTQLLRIYTTGSIMYYRDYENENIEMITEIIDNTWYHVRLEVDVDNDIWSYWHNNINVVDDAQFWNGVDVDNINYLTIGSYGVVTEIVYYDAIGYSWQVDYRPSHTFTFNELIPNTEFSTIGIYNNWTYNKDDDTNITIRNTNPIDNEFLKFYDDNNNGYPQLRIPLIESISNSYSFYLRTNDITKESYIFLQDGVNDRIYIYVSTSTLRIWNGIIDTEIMAITNNVWYNISIDFDCLTDTSDIYVDSNLKGTYDFYANSITIDYLEIRTDLFDTGYILDLDFITNLEYNKSIYFIGLNLFPYLYSTGFNEVDKYEFALQDINSLIPINTKEALGWSQSGAENELVIIIEDPYDSNDRVYKLSTDDTGQTKGINNDDFTSTDNFITIDMEFEIIDMTGNNGTHTIILESSDDNYIAMLDFRSNGSMNIFQAVDDYWGLQVRNDITTGKIYRVIMLINYELERTFIDFYIDGIYDDSYNVSTFYSGKNGLAKISLLVHSVDYTDLHWNIDNIGVYSNGISQTIEYGYSVYNTGLNWNTQIHNLLFLKANGSFNIGIIEGSYTVGMSMTEFRSMRNYYNSLHTINGYNSNDYIINATFVFTLQNHYFNISTFKIEGVLLKEGINEYNLIFEHSGVDIDKSYFYVSDNRLYFYHIANDTNLEYIQARFNINDINSTDYSISFRSYIDNNAYGYIRINFTDTSNLIQLPFSHTTTRFILSQERVIRDLVILITDKDNNVITGLTSGYIYNIELLDILNIQVSVITESLLNMMIPLIIILTPTLIFAKKFGKEVIIPFMILFSLVLTITSTIPPWLFFIILFPSLIMIFFKSSERV